MSKRIMIPWGGKAKKSLALILKPYEASVVSKNILIILTSREIRISDYVKKYSEEESTRKRYIRVFFSEPITPLNEEPYPRFHGGIIENFDVRYTNLGFSKYLTLIVPGSFLYNYIVLTENSLSIECSVKKSVYFEEYKTSLTIYFV